MKLDAALVVLILCSALMHASWNAIVKADRRHRLTSFGIIMATGTVIGAIALPFAGPMSWAGWPWLALSGVIHVFYFFFLLSAYAHGDLSHVYPIARGLGPTLVAIFSGTLIGEHLLGYELAGVLLVSLGVMGLALAKGLSNWGGRGTVFAVVTGVTIAGYTVTDGLGSRASGNAIAYIAWLNVVEGPWVLAYALWVNRPTQVVGYMRVEGWRACVGGVIATLGYGLAIYALSIGAMAHVAALRETSVLFATVIGTRILGEPFGLRRLLAAGLIVTGLVLMNLRL
ncbi:MAG: EamA family transporter [Alphaproteobacteria bacterium]|nr:EamA family transporter [Alphaproteobacteria bacterium]